VWRAGLVVLPATAIVLLGYSHRFMSDDGLIYTRVVRQILAGNGPVFNATERAEASTSTVWPWLVALGSGFSGVSPERVAVFGGLALTALGLAVAVDATCRLYGDERAHPLLVPAGVVLLIGLPPVWDFATSGLETGLGTFWLGACWWLLVRAGKGLGGRQAALVAAVFGLGPMIRPDFTLFSLCFLVALLVLTWSGAKCALVLLLAAGALPFAYEVFRAGYYGVLVPLPALAKEGMSPYWSRGLRYVGDFVAPYWLWWPLAGVALLLGVMRPRWRRLGREIVVATPVVAGLVTLLYVVAVGGDFMHARMLLPPLMTLLLPVLVVPVTKATVIVASAIAVWAVLGLTPLRPPFGGRADVQHIRHVDQAVTKTANPVTAQQWIRGFPRFPEQVEAALATGEPTVLYGSSNNFLKTRARPDIGSGLVVHGGWLGTVGAVVPLDQTVADEWSLAYPLGAHFKLERRALFAGHEKPVSWVWALADYADPRGPPPEGVDPAQLAAARRALGCGELRELQESVRAPMSPARFWRNVTGSLRRTTLRVPTDPFAAERRFCGGG
jgi:arabinofuranosyltransferase